MPGFDVHAHVVPPTVLDAARRGEHGLELDGETLVVDGDAVPAPLLDPPALVRWLDEHGLDGAAVSIPPPLYRLGLPAANAAAWAALVNDGLAEVANGSDGRLVALAHLPLTAPKLAPDEGRRCRGAPWAGVALPCATPGPGLDDDRLRDLWEALDDERRFVFLHPPMGRPADARLERWHLANLLGNGYETALAAATLVFSGLLARHAQVRICLAHAGGAVPALAGRWQHAVASGHRAVPALELTPAEALRRLYADSVAHSSGALALALDVFGPRHVLLGSDWPFPMGDLAALGDVDPELRRAFACQNPTGALEVLPRQEAVVR